MNVTNIRTIKSLILKSTHAYKYRGILFKCIYVSIYRYIYMYIDIIIVYIYIYEKEKYLFFIILNIYKKNAIKRIKDLLLNLIKMSIFRWLYLLKFFRDSEKFYMQWFLTMWIARLRLEVRLKANMVIWSKKVSVNKIKTKY